MSKGFFAGSLVVSDRPASLIPKCGACGAWQLCQTPKMPHVGEGRRGILIVGDMPTRGDDAAGRHWDADSAAAMMMQQELENLGVDMMTDCWLTNSLICHPPRKTMDKKKRPLMVDYCRPNLMRTVKELQPTTVILMGQMAVRSLIGGIWKENPGSLDKWAGFNIPDHSLNAWICPTYHPHYLDQEKNSVLDLYFRRHLRTAIEHEGRPWNPVPDWEKNIEVIMDTDEAARIIREYLPLGGVAALDYENNTLRPETPGGKILCASLCFNYGRTIAFPWHGAAIEATRELIHSDKWWFIAANMKHEERWSKKEFGRGVRHWLWDTMIAAHVIDNREGGICSLKFQAYVELGMPAYDDHIKQFLKSTDERKINQAAEEINMHQLLKYCGFDTFLEARLARKGHRRLYDRGVEFLPPAD